MTSFYEGMALFLLLTLIAGFVRVFVGPERGDRILAVLLFGTTSVAILLLLAEARDSASLRDVALVFSVLAVINTAVFVRRLGPTSGTGDQQ